VWGVGGGGGGLAGRLILPNSRAMVLQQYEQCRRAGRLKKRLSRAQTTNSKAIFCKGQGTLRPTAQEKRKRDHHTGLRLRSDAASDCGKEKLKLNCSFRY